MYKFAEEEGGLMAYRFPNGDWPDSRHDRVAFALSTNQASGTIFKMESGSGKDSVEIYLVGCFCC